MCECCGCQALEAIGEPTREHERVVHLISHLRDARRDGAVARMAELAPAIAAVLGPHTQVEERGLVPAPTARFPERIAVLEDEHRRIEAVPAEAGGPYLTDSGWPDRLTEARAVLRVHIRKGQDGVFPAALANLCTEEWQAVGAERLKAGGALSRSAA